MTRRPEKKNRRKNIILRLILPVLAAYAVIVLVDMQISLAQRKQELETLRIQTEQQRLINKDLQRELKSEVDEDYIERYARDYLDYVAPDEKVFIDISGS